MNSKHITLCLVFLISLSGKAQSVIELKVNPNKVIGNVDEKIYGMLLEHLYHSVSNGVWGETVWNRSFEELHAQGGNWTVNSDKIIRLEAFSSEVARFHLGLANDFELSLDFKKAAGKGSILICLRDQFREAMLTNGLYIHFGTVNNSVHQLETKTGWIWHTPITKTAIVESKVGSLGYENWQSVQITCKGNRITCSLDGKLLFDEEIENSPKDGSIRIGSENCKAEFRNIKINSLGTQDTKLAFNPVRHWQLVGNGSVSTTRENVANQNVAVFIHSTDKMAGIEQAKNFRVRTGDLLKGSLFLKGDVTKVLLQLLNGEKVIASQTLSGLTSVWKEFQITLPSSEDCDQATLRILTTEKGDLYIDQVSLMHQSSISIGGYRTDLFEAVNKLRPTIIRWPGGSFSEQYNFENGIGPQATRKGILRWDDFDPLSFGTDEFMEYCRQIGAEPQIVIPIGYHNYKGYAPDTSGQTDWLQKAIDWVEYCNGDTMTVYGAKRAANGHPEPYKVKYWELDNEVWKMDAQLYAQLSRIFSQTMKLKDPSIKIIGCGSGRLGKEGIGLDSILIHSVAEYIDYISPHHYMELNKFGNDGMETYRKYLKKLDGWISKSKNPNMKIYVSEWNLEKNDMRTGLFAGGILNEFERLPRVEMAAFALALRHISATGWDNAFINFDQNGYFTAPNYVVMKLWRDHYAPNLIYFQGETVELNVVATKSEDGKQIFLKMVNPTNKGMAISVKVLDEVGDASLQTISSVSLTDGNNMALPDKIKPVLNKIVFGEESLLFSLPAYSASVLIIKLK